MADPARSPRVEGSSLRAFAACVSSAGWPFWCGSIAAAAAEGAIGWWLKLLPIGDPSKSKLLLSWLLLLLAFLTLRVLASWFRDQAQEIAGLRAGDRFVRSVWRRPDRDGNAPWFTREGREAVELGTRAALVLAASAVALAVLLPLMVWLSPLLSCALLLVAPLLGGAGRRRWRAAREWAGREHELLTRHAADETWSWRAAPEAVASGQGRPLSRSRRTASVALARERLAGGVRTIFGQALTEAAAHAGGWLLAALALLSWSRGLLTGPDLLAFLAAALLAYRPIREAGRALPSWHRLLAVLGRERDTARSVPAPPPAGPLIAHSLRVRSREGKLLVDGPTFELAPGEVFLLSGANGSGKTSLIAGIVGWHESTGVVSRPRIVRTMAQEPVLPPFAPSRWSGAETPESLPLHGVLFPDGLPCSWDAPIAEGGTRLSRGERARLALLCLTATPADLWIFDEPFSALPLAERAPLLAALRAVQGHASFLFSDPLSIDPVDAPVVWEAGPGQTGPRIYRL